jgi:TusA-related sulfurtransferase
MSNQIDARGKLGPMPVVLAARTLRMLSLGETLVILADDGAFAADIAAWCRKTGNRLVGVATRDGYFEASVERSA